MLLFLQMTNTQSPTEKYDIYPSGKPWAFSSQIIIYNLTVIKHTQLSYNQISQVVLLD